MVKAQQFFTNNKVKLVWLITVGLILAEGSRFLLPGLLIYKVLMAVLGIIGVMPILLTAISSLQVKLVSIDVLISIAVIGAFIIGEYNEAAIVTWLFLLGEVLENASLGKTRSAVKQLVQKAPEKALVINSKGEAEEQDVDFVDPGDCVMVKTGSQVPVDGEIEAGTGTLNESSITGESKLVKKTAGDHVYAGTILDNGTLTVKTTAAGEDTTFGKIIELVEEAQDSKTHAQRFIDKFSKYYTPFVLLVALLVGVLTQNVRLAITVMVLGCPGALVIGVPASTVAGIGNGAKHGVLFKGSNVMDQLSHTDVIAFDKTGTLTAGKPSVASINIINGDRQQIIDEAVAVEGQSNHPLAQAIARLSHESDPKVSNINTVKGAGIQAVVGNKGVSIGNQRLASIPEERQTELIDKINYLTNDGQSIAIFSSDDESQLAVFGIKDQLRPDAIKSLARLKQLGVKKLVMLTGDNEATAAKIAQSVPIDEFHAEMLPEDKVDFVKEEQSKGNRVAFVGDGINDSPALSQADVAVGMGSGTDVAVDVSDLVLVKSQLVNLVTGLRLSKRTMANMKQNIVIALLTVLLLFIGLFAGYIEMASGMLVHELSILIVIFNSLRLIRG